MIVALLEAPAPGSQRLAAQLADLPDRARARIVRIAAAAPRTVLDELATIAARAAENGEGVAVVPGDLVVSDRLMLNLLDDPRKTTRLLVTPTEPLPDGGLGALHVRAADATAAATAWHHAAGMSDDAAGDPARTAAVAVEQADVPIAVIAQGGYVAGRDAALLRAAATLDEDDVTWRGASRSGDGVWSTFALRPVSRRVTRRAVRRGFTPNQVTVAGFGLGLAAAALIAVGATGTTIAGALLLQVALVLDCVDGEIARSTRSFSAFGAWLDLVTDRVKEAAVLGAVALAEPKLWPLAAACLGLQLTRHMADYAFADSVLAWWRRRSPGARALETPTGRGLAHWVKQAIHMQIGERWLLLSVTLIVGTFAGGGMLVLVAYLVAVGVGLAWVLLGWTLRTLTSPLRRTPLPPDVGRVVTALRDDLTTRPARAALAWYVPMLVTAIEAVTWVAVASTSSTAIGGWVFVWGFAVAWHRYDVFYRSRGGRVPVPRWVAIAGGGVAGRWVVLAVVLLAPALSWLVPAGAIWLLLVFVPESLFSSTPRIFPRSLGVLRKQVRRAVAVPVERLFMRLAPPQRFALVAGLPDTEENSLATAAVLAQRYAGEVVLVAADLALAREQLDRVAALLDVDATRVRVVPKKSAFSLFIRAEVVFYTHGLYDSPAPVGRRLHVNLWHGTGPKWNANANFAQRIGAQAHAASSPLWGLEAVRALSLGPATRIVAGNPRQDVVAAARDRTRLAALGVDPARPVVVWLPTFRSSATAGHVGLREGDPLTAEAGRAFADAATRHGVQLVAKPHRLDSELFESLGVTVLTDEQIRAAGATLHEVLGLADGMLSDYSSGWVDVLDRDISIALYAPDIDTYRTARGLNLPDLAVAADGLLITAADADSFFAAVAAGTVWHAAELHRTRGRIELIDVAAGARTATMLDELAALATELFGDDLGLCDHRRSEVTSS